MKVGNIKKAATVKIFLRLSFKNTQLLFLWKVLFNIIMRQILIDGFWELHKNMNCAFPLKKDLEYNRSITEFYNGNDDNVIAAELQLTKTRSTSFYKEQSFIASSC